MRALISLYHQSDTWITPDNLDACIDLAFTQPRDAYLSFDRAREETSKKDLEYAITVRERASKTGGAPGKENLLTNRNLNQNLMWSDTIFTREREVEAALLGHDLSGQPGLGNLRAADAVIAQAEQHNLK
jgi:hypothetical protein